MKVEEEINQVVQVLRKGGVILYPSDTIWGIGCDATNEEAVRRIYQIKKRPDKRSFLILTDSVAMLRKYVHNIPRSVLKALQSTVSPTTFIFSEVSGIASGLVRDDGTTGIRIPKDPFCLELIRRLKAPLVSTSANYSSQPSPVNFRAIDPALKDEVDYVVKWRQDDLREAVPSRIVRIMSDGIMEIIRD